MAVALRAKNLLGARIPNLRASGAHNGKGRPTLLRTLSTGPLTTSPILLRPGGRKRPIRWRAATLSSPLSQRFASSQASASTVSTAPPPQAAPPVAEFPPPEESSAALLNDYYASEADPFTPYIGFLRDAGLDFGWGPSSLLQWSVEHIFVYSGLPWWSAIVLTSLAVRLVTFKFVLDSADASARMATVSAALRPLQDRMMEARRRQDAVEQQQVMRQISAAYKGAGVSFKSMFIPVLIQMPLGFGAFRTLRTAATEDVPGLADGGFLWVADLTARDPYLILPATTATLLYYTFKRGGEMPGAGLSNPGQAGMMAWVRRILPPLSFVMTCWLPASVQVYFASTGVIAFWQNRLMTQPGFRARVGIHPLPDPPKPKSSTDEPSAKVNTFKILEDKTHDRVKAFRKEELAPGVSLRERFRRIRKGAWEMGQWQQEETARLNQRAKEAAKRYEERRREEIKAEKWAKKKS